MFMNFIFVELCRGGSFSLSCFSIDYNTIDLSVLLQMGIWVLTRFLLLQFVLLWTFSCSFFVHMCKSFSRVYTLKRYVPFYKLMPNYFPKWFPKWLHQFLLPPTLCKSPPCSMSFKHLTWLELTFCPFVGYAHLLFPDYSWGWASFHRFIPLL